METLKEIEGGLGLGELGKPVGPVQGNERAVYDLNEDHNYSTMKFMGSENIEKENNFIDLTEETEEDEIDDFVKGNEVNVNGNEGFVKGNEVNIHEEGLVEGNEVNVEISVLEDVHEEIGGENSGVVIEQDRNFEGVLCNLAEDKKPVGEEIGGFSSLEDTNGVNAVEKGVENSGVIIEQDRNFEGVLCNLAEDKKRVGDENGGFSSLEDKNGVNAMEKGVENSGVVIEQDRNFEGVKSNLTEDKKRVSDDFSVGDFVWGKIKGQTWWPGQIYDSSNASNFASKFKHSDKNQILVAYFGDGSCAWCFKTNLKPFVEHFEELSKQSKSRSFENSVKSALDEIGRQIELQMVGPLVRPDLVSHEVVNAGVKPGVFVPESDVSELWMKYTSKEVFDFVKKVAKDGFIDNMLELMVLKRWISAFYWVRKGKILANYHDPKEIEGLEDKNDVNTLESPIKGPVISELNESTKQKSVAELMGEGKIEISKSPVSTPLSSKRKQKEYSGELSGEEAPEKSQSQSQKSRERKKSKYLSPPYTNQDYSWLKLNKKITKIPSLSHDIPEMVPISKCTSVEGKKGLFGNISIPEVLFNVKSAGIDLKSVKDGKIEMIKGFITAFKSSVSLHEEKVSGKRKLPEVPELPESQKVKVTKVKKATTPVTLIVKFTPGAILPLKEDLVKVFREYGDVNVEKTKVSVESNSAEVAYAEVAYAEEAFRECIKQSPLGSFCESYSLKYSSASARALESNGQKKSDEISQVDLVKEKLGIVRVMLENCEGKVTEEEKMGMKKEMRSLLEKVNDMVVKI